MRGTSTITANSSANRESRVPIAGISSTGLTTIVNEAYSSYNALLVTVTHQLTNNFLLKMAYTHSRSIDNFPASASTGSGGSGQIGNQYVLSENTGTSEQDVPNRFVTTYVWDLPDSTIIECWIILLDTGRCPGSLRIKMVWREPSHSRSLPRRLQEPPGMAW